MTDDFWFAVADAMQRPDLAGPHMLGSRLAWAAARTLGADGVGLSLSADPAMRVPLGASSEDAGSAERLQFTAGEGPCLEAFEQHVPVMATEAVIARCWPVFAAELHHRTSYRSVLAVPLGNLGAVDVLFEDPAGCSLLAMGEVLLVVQQILTAILDDRLFSVVTGGVLWTTRSARRRGQVSVAMGMLTVVRDVTHRETLAAMRAFAFAHGDSLEDVAAHVIDGTLPADALLP